VCYISVLERRITTVYYIGVLYQFIAAMYYISVLEQCFTVVYYSHVLQQIPDDGSRPKHVGASQSNFNANFKNIKFNKQCVCWCVNCINIITV
jgi:hypothetical protein